MVCGLNLQQAPGLSQIDEIDRKIRVALDLVKEEPAEAAEANAEKVAEKAAKPNGAPAPGRKPRPAPTASA